MSHRPADLLNELLELARDGERFYRDAAAHVLRPELRGTFAQMAELRLRLMNDLAEHVTARGERPSDRRTLLGTSRQLYADARAAFSTKDDRIYLRQLTAMEDRLLAHYERALSDAAADSVRHILRRHLLTVRASHDRMHLLKDRSLAA